MLLEVLGGESLYLFKINKIDMTELVISTEASEKFKETMNSKKEEEPEVDKKVEKGELNQELKTINEEIK